MIEIDSIPRLIFAGSTLRCMVLRAPIEPPQLQTWRTHFAGVAGESELRGRSGARALPWSVLIFGDFDTRNELWKYTEGALNSDLLGKHGELVYQAVAGPAASRWRRAIKHCTFQGFAEEGPALLDIAGTLNGKWHTRGTLHFRQLFQGDDA